MKLTIYNTGKKLKIAIVAIAISVSNVFGQGNSGGAGPIGDKWDIFGNELDTTNLGTSFLGSINLTPLILKTNNRERLSITSSSGQVKINSLAGSVWSY